MAVRSPKPSGCNELVDRQNLYVKIPATNAGLAAIEDTIAAGIPVNVTLIFSLKRHREVIDAYLTGLERLIDSGGDPSDVSSVASFFVSRVDTETDRRLDELGGHDELRARLGIANAKFAYQQYREKFAGARWEKLKARGARPQRCLWASTPVKDPRSPDTMYVEQLAGAETVNTMPPETLSAVQDHGTIAGQTIDRDLEDALQVFTRLKAAGVDYDDVTATLEAEGVKKFADAFDQLFENIKAKRDGLAAASR
jgi:transaldolase